MRIIKKAFLAYTLLITLAAYSQVKKYPPVVIEGKVIAEVTGKPVDQAHVYILDGEEEALTNSKGEFRIESWQKTPLKLTVDNYYNYQRVSIVVTDPSKKQVIRLKIKLQ